MGKKTAFLIKCVPHNMGEIELKKMKISLREGWGELTFYFAD